MNQNTETFIETFNQLEMALKNRLGKDRFTPFHMLLKEASNRDSFIRLHRSLLESFSDLRNVLVHKEGNTIIAIPSDEAVEALSAIVNKYTEPKSVYDVCHKQVIITTPNKSLYHALKLMKRHDYTKIPVYDGNNYQGLLSGNMVTRWLTSHVTDEGKGLPNLDQVKISDVIEVGNRKGQVRFVAKDMAVYEFVHSNERKPSKSGVYILTEHGNSNEKAMGIITAFDYQKILETLMI